MGICTRQLRTHGMMLAVGLGLLGAAAPSAHVASAACLPSLIGDVTPVFLRNALASCGVSAEVLCAAGVPADQVGPMCARGREFLADRGHDWGAAIEREHAARASLRRAMDAGTITAGQVFLDNVNAARAELASAQAALDGIAASFMASLTRGLADTDRCRIDSLVRNRQHAVPVFLRVIDRPNTEWKVLEAAYTESRAASRGLRSPNPDMQACWANACGNAECVAAKIRLDQQLPEFKVTLDAELAVP